MQTLKQREVMLAKSEMQDTLIDLEMHDVVDLIRIYSVLGQSKPQAHVPDLFPDPLRKTDNALSTQDNLAAEVLMQVQKPILHKVQGCSLANLSDILLAYSAVSPSLLDSGDLNFVGMLEKAVIDKVTTKDYFNTLNATKIMWALAKQKNQHLVPSFGSDVASVLLQRSDLQPGMSVIQIIPKLFCIDILDKKKVLGPMNAALTLYSMTAVGFYDQEFFEAVVL